MRITCLQGGPVITFKLNKNSLACRISERVCTNVVWVLLYYYYYYYIFSKYTSKADRKCFTSSIRTCFGYIPLFREKCLRLSSSRFNVRFVLTSLIILWKIFRGVFLSWVYPNGFSWSKLSKLFTVNSLKNFDWKCCPWSVILLLLACVDSQHWLTGVWLIGFTI